MNMSQRVGTTVSDHDIVEALHSLLRQPSTPRITFSSLNDVVVHLESKLGFDLTHKVDFIRNQIHLLFRSQPPPQPPQPPHLQQQQRTNHQYQQPQQSPNFHPPSSQPHHFALERGHQPPPPRSETPHFALHQNPHDVGYRSQQQQPPPGSSEATHFALHQRAHDDLGFRPPQQSPPSNRSEVSHLALQQHAGEIGSRTKQLSPPDGATSATSSTAAEDPSSPTVKRKRGGTGGLNKLCGVSPELQAIVGQPQLPRTEIVRQLWVYIRKNNLQDPNNKRKIICNDELRLVFETDCTDMFKMNKLLSKHIITLDPSKPAREISKKVKVEGEPVKESTEESTEESGLIVIISEALGNFFGIGEREMPQSEVLRRVWEYIKVHQLEDPMNSMAIRCDEKLQDLFGCPSISAMGIPEMLARHHLFKRS